jgi:hypothetical protein
MRNLKSENTKGNLKTVKKKPSNKRGKNCVLALFMPKLWVLPFEGSKFPRNLTPANSEGNL